VFFTSHALVLPHSGCDQRAADSRERYLLAIPTPLGTGVRQYNDTQLDEQNRRARTGLHVLSGRTLATRLRVLRDLAAHICAHRRVTGWAEVTTVDLAPAVSADPASPSPPGASSIPETIFASVPSTNRTPPTTSPQTAFTTSRGTTPSAPSAGSPAPCDLEEQR
jgi:hypothetical protein